MSASLMTNNNLGLSSSCFMIMDEEANKLSHQKQGIVSILGSDCDNYKTTTNNNNNRAASLRRTLSADMSSKKWLSQNGLISPMKKIASSEEFSLCIAEYSSNSSTDEYEEEEEEEYEQDRKKQWNKNKKEVDGQLDIWSSIVSQKKQEQDNSDAPAPYIHPLVKRSASTLSEKSLQVCTESLGSETGSDGFSSYPSSEMGDVEDEQEQQQQQGFDNSQEVRVAKYNFSVGKKLSPPSFPPPLPSLARRDGPALRMRPHRENGRLVLEAVSVPSQNNFRAQREDGRLVLTFVNVASKEEAQNQEEVQEEKDGVEELEEYFGHSEEEDEYEDTDSEDEEDEEEEEETEVEKENRGGEIEIMMEQTPKMTSGVIKLHRLALMMNKPMGLAARNPTWQPHKFNEVVKFEQEAAATPLAQSLPPRPPVAARLIPSPPAASPAAAAASFNAYDYCWRAKPTAAQAMEKNSTNKYIISKNSSIMRNDDHHDQKKQELVVIEGKKGAYLVPLLKGCKEHRRSMFLEPYCIATS